MRKDPPGFILQMKIIRAGLDKIKQERLGSKTDRNSVFLKVQMRVTPDAL